MALLAEQLVDEWLNRSGFFTLRGIKSGVHEIDLLGVRMSKGRLEGWHVECQVSFRPVSYIGRLSKERQQELGAKSATSAIKRPQHVVKADFDDWVEKKFKAPKKKEMRDLCWRDINWQYKFVHGKVREKSELTFIEARGVELISFDKVLKELCEHKPGELFGGAGTDIAEIIWYYAEKASIDACTDTRSTLSPTWEFGRRDARPCSRANYARDEPLVGSGHSIGRTARSDTASVIALKAASQNLHGILREGNAQTIAVIVHQPLALPHASATLAASPRWSFVRSDLVPISVAWRPRGAWASRPPHHSALRRCYG